jgi:hypothetical protein
MWIVGHPGYGRLNRFADGGLTDREHARVADHLAQCARCREDVTFIRTTGDAARALPTPPVAAEALETILRRRAAGDRVILPVADAGPDRERPPRRSAAAAAVAMLAVFTAGMVFSVGVLQADRPGLRIVPERPAPGEMLRLEYRGGTVFDDQPHLRIRAWYGTADGQNRQLDPGVLVRDLDGVHRAEIRLPEDVVYAAFAVETPAGDRLDANDGRLWEVLEHVEDAPTLAALWARHMQLVGRQPDEAYRVSVDMTERYPSAPRGWVARMAHEFGTRDLEEHRERYAEIYHGLERQLSVEASEHDDRLAWLATLALMVGDTVGAEVWVRRAMGAPGGTGAALTQARALILGVRTRGNPAARLEGLETIWTESAHPVRQTAQMGLSTAVSAGDVAAIERWLPRYEAAFSGASMPLLLAGIRLALESDAVRERIEALLEETGEVRPLWRTTAEHERIQRQSRQAALATYAGLLHGDGALARAAVIAARSVELGWDRDALVDAGRVLLDAGDTATATTAFARAAADPRPLTVPDAVSRSPHWISRVSAERNRLYDYVRASGVIRYPAEDLMLTTAAGPVPFDSVAPGPTVVVFGSAFFARPTFPAKVRELAELLEPWSVPVVVVDLDATLDTLAHGSPAVAVFADSSGAVRRSFQSVGVSDFFVLDDAGRIRFGASDPQEIPRQLAALGYLRATPLVTVAD